MILSFLKKKFSLKKTFSHLFQYLENLRENRGPKVVFWKDCAFSLNKLPSFLYIFFVEGF